MDGLMIAFDAFDGSDAAAPEHREKRLADRIAEGVRMGGEGGIGPKNRSRGIEDCQPLVDVSDDQFIAAEAVEEFGEGNGASEDGVEVAFAEVARDLGRVGGDRHHVRAGHRAVNARRLTDQQQAGTHLVHKASAIANERSTSLGITSGDRARVHDMVGQGIILTGGLSPSETRE
jgi:hypothetical protein